MIEHLRRDLLRLRPEREKNGDPRDDRKTMPPTRAEVNAAIVSVIHTAVDNSDNELCYNLLAYAAYTKTQTADQSERDAIQAGIEELFARRAQLPIAMIPVNHPQIQKDCRVNLSEILIGEERNLTEAEEAACVDQCPKFTGLGALIDG